MKQDQKSKSLTDLHTPKHPSGHAQSVAHLQVKLYTAIKIMHLM